MCYTKKKAMGADNMSIDALRDKIRKTKNPSVLELGMSAKDIPPQILESADSTAAALGFYCQELLVELKGLIPAVRIRFGEFALLGPDGISQLQHVLHAARENQYYVLLEAPELLNVASAENAAESLMADSGAYPCDGVIISGYMGSDVLKPFLPYCKKGGKTLFAVCRTGNKSAPELQDLLAGTRLVHIAAADHVNRYTAGTMGKCGYSCLGLLAAASSAQSLRELRGKYPQLFLLVDGYDYPNANAKNCSFAFDKLGCGGAVCAGSSIYGAWQQEGENSAHYLESAKASAERMRKNLTRYVSVL